MTEELPNVAEVAPASEKKMNTNAKKKLRKKIKRAEKELKAKTKLEISSDQENDSGIDVDIDYVPEAFELDGEEFSKLLEKFKFRNKESELQVEVSKPSGEPSESKLFSIEDDDVDNNDEDEKIEVTISNKQMKRNMRLSVAQLKQLVSRPDLVHRHDVCASDPKLLLLLKSSRNCVPVPKHWCSKSKYLQRKRCVERAPFHLPENIRATGIMEMRQSLQEQMDAKNLKSKMKEKVRPKMGKTSLDYQTMHDCFFKYATKPQMTKHGDLYHEGKEYETRYKDKKPGIIPDVLREALHMTTGYGAEKCPPPWLTSMQRLGPPPAYPNLKVPGVNAPPPEGCEYGHHVGGWGEAPIDGITKMPIYAGAFGGSNDEFQFDDVDKSFMWGVMGERDSDNEFDDEEEEEEEEQDTKATEEVKADVSGQETSDGMEISSGIDSVVSTCFETPDSIELRKKRIEDEMEDNEERQLYTVLPEKQGKFGRQIMPSAFIYDTTGISKPKKGEVIVTFNPDELDDEELQQKRISEALNASMNQAHPPQEDMSQMFIEHAKNQKKRKGGKDRSDNPKKIKF